MGASTILFRCAPAASGDAEVRHKCVTADLGEFAEAPKYLKTGNLFGWGGGIRTLDIGFKDPLGCHTQAQGGAETP